ncbi:MAG: MMPL family transporter, partial [Stellaceae bacterium]
LPALLTLLRPHGEPRAVGFARLATLQAALVAHRRVVLLVSALLAAGSAALLPRLGFDFNPLDLQSPHTEAMQVLNELKSDPNETPYTVSVLTPSIEAAVSLADRLDALPEVAQTITAASFIPEDQEAKLAIISDTAMLLGITLSPITVKPAPSDAQALQAISTCLADMSEAGAHGIPSAVRLAGLLRQVVARGAAALPALNDNLVTGLPRRLADLKLALQAKPVTLSTLPEEIKRDWITPDGRALVQIFPKTSPSNEGLARFVDAVLRVAPDATGSPVTIQASADTVTHAFAVAGVIAIAAIAALLLIVLRRLSHVGMVLAPLILAGLLTLATMTLAGMQLNYANIIALPLLLGIGVAFDVYFVMRWRGGADDLLQSSTARAILFSALTTGTAFGSLAISSNPGMAEMGKLLSLALGYTLLCTFILLPALLGAVPRAADGGPS